jgi:hypothetical protein
VADEVEDEKVETLKGGPVRVKKRGETVVVVLHVEWVGVVLVCEKGISHVCTC